MNQGCVVGLELGMTVFVDESCLVMGCGLDNQMNSV